jgi:PAS domain S-box-containing protein
MSDTGALKRPHAESQLSQSSPTPQSAPPRLQFRVPPKPAYLLRARERLRDYLRQYCTERRVIDDVVVCVEEACTNAIRHSGAGEDIEITLQFDSDRLLAAVKDHGQGFDTTSFDPQRTPDPTAEHGRGLFIIAALMDEVELHLDGGLEVRMWRHAEPRCDAPRLESGLGETGAGADAERRDARTRAMLEEIDEAFFALDWEYRYLHANHAALRLTQKSLQELVGHTPWELFPKLRGSLLEERYREAMELGMPSVFERRSTLNDDWHEVRVYPTEAGISAYYREVNERKRIEQEVLASRSQLAATLAAITDGFYTLDRTWRVTFLNDEAAAVFPGGKEACGADFWELFPEAVGSDFETNKRRAMELGEFRSFESYYPRFDTWFEERDYPSDRLLEKTGLLLEAATAASSWSDLDRLLGSLGDLLVRASGHSRVVLELWDEEHQEVEIAVARGSEAMPLQRFEFEDISRAAKEALTTKRTVVMDSAQSDPPGAPKQALGPRAFLLLLAVPIVHRDRPIGVILMDQPGERRLFSSQEVQLVEAIAAQAGAAIESARLLEREAEALRFETSAPLGGTSRLVSRLRTHPYGVLAGSVAVESAILAALSAAHETSNTLGVPGSLVALIAVVAGALAGPLVGALVALAGGVAFFATMAGFGNTSSAFATTVSTAIWLAAGLLSGFLAQDLREQTERRRVAAVALARADAAREVQLAEQAQIEELATGLQAQTDALAERADLADALNAINAVVHSTLDFDDIMGRALAQGVAALHADAGTIVLRDGDSWVVAYQYGFSHEEVGLRLSADEAPIATGVSATGQAVAIADLEMEPRLSVGFSHAHGLRAVVAVPLIVRKEVTGDLAFWEHQPRLFSETETDFANQLGSTISLAVDNAHLYLEQQRIAITLQDNFIHPPPAVAGLELGIISQAAFAPGLVGGDFSDVFLLDESHVVVLIGDVAGKGVRAAGHTETVRSTVRALATIDSSPAFVLGKTNELLLRFEPDEPLVTAFLAVLDLHSGSLTYASAGHPAPVHLGAAGCQALDETVGLPLGSFEHGYANAHVMLSPEDYLVLYTDGVTEARCDGELFGEPRLFEAVCGLRGRSAQGVAEGVSGAALAFAGELSDDLQVVVLRLA